MDKSKSSSTLGARQQPDHGPKHITSLDQLSDEQKLTFYSDNGETKKVVVATSGPYQEDEYGFWVIDVRYLDDDLAATFALCDFGVVPFIPGQYQDDAWVERVE